MLRRIALKNIAVITGSTFILPYGCDFETEMVYSNFSSFTKKQFGLLASISEFIFPSIVKYLLIITILFLFIIQYPDLKLPFSNLTL